MTRVASNALRAELHKSLLVGSAPKPLKTRTKLCGCGDSLTESPLFADT